MQNESWVVENATLPAGGYNDGDTVDATAMWAGTMIGPFGLPFTISLPLFFRVRLPGINAAKLPTAAGGVVKIFVRDWCNKGPFDVVSHTDHYKYGGPEYIAKQYVPWAQFMADLRRGDEYLSQVLLDHLLVTYWDGKGTRPMDGDK